MICLSKLASSSSSISFFSSSSSSSSSFFFSLQTELHLHVFSSLLQPSMLDQYDWDKPAKLIVGKDIDLSKNSKDGSFSKMFAEQITIMEYCCYCAIQRR